jgi:TetR/AcrR family transcriptional regulator, transcriptional repressor for nem operon
MLRYRKKSRRKGATPRNPERTRERLLQAAFQEVYKSGFRGTDLDTILAAARVTKGALYHHFESKEDLGYALVDEVILGITREKWVGPLQNMENPIDALVGILQSRSTERDELHYGCPLNNLAQEMSPLDEGFRKRLARVFSEWNEAIAKALRKGQKQGLVRSDVDPGETTTFLIATFEGCLSLAKTAQNVRVLRSAKGSMIRYLESLRAADSRARRLRAD